MVKRSGRRLRPTIDTTAQILLFFKQYSFPRVKLVLFFGSASFGCGMNSQFKLGY